MVINTFDTTISNSSFSPIIPSQNFSTKATEIISKEIIVIREIFCIGIIFIIIIGIINTIIFNPLALSFIHTGDFQNVRVKSPINNGIGIGDRKDITGIASYTPIDE